MLNCSRYVAALVASSALLACVLPACDGPGGDNGKDVADAGSDANADTNTDATDTQVDADTHDSDATDEDTDSGEELSANAGDSRYADLGTEVTLDGSASTGAVEYQWDFGNGDGWDERRDTPIAAVSFDEPGRYRAVLTAFDDIGRSRSDQVTISVTAPPSFDAANSSSVIARSEGGAAVVSPDSDELLLASNSADTFRAERRLDTCDTPRTVAEVGERYAVACQGDDQLWVVDPYGGDTLIADFGHGARPFGVIAVGQMLYVTLQGPGEVAVLNMDAANGTDLPVQNRLAAVVDARTISLLPDQRLAVTRWRSPDERGEVAVIDPSGALAAEIWPLAYDDQAASDTETGGVPSYLSGVVVSPQGNQAIVPSLQANIGQGLYLNNEPLTHQFTVRAAISFLDLEARAEAENRRKLFDDRGLAAAATYSPRGDYVYVAMRGSRIIERYDALTRVESGSIIDTGFAPQGLAMSANGRFLFVDAYLSRELVVFDTGDFASFPEPIARIPIPSSEPLPGNILLGKQLFNDSFDLRLTKDAYIACAHCHLDGESDLRTWDFTDRGEGLRNTISLEGRAGMGDGPLHWSANFDEVHDFENDIRFEFLGDGLMTDDAFEQGTRSDPLGDPKAGASDDLDALAAYVTSLRDVPKSPHRKADGSLTDAAVRGKTIFESTEAGCTDCHTGERLTDSQFLPSGEPLVHDVGTQGAGSGQRLGATLTGIDTPTLHGLWNSAPYLHDGSAPTLRDVMTTANPDDEHGKTSHLSEAQVDDLVAYLRSLDGRAD
jgi:DNA-binding beta-propeller fold protein YncE/mono/diheme cytochrome c family protein